MALWITAKKGKYEICICTNRKKRMEQKTDSLEDWFISMTEKYGREEAERMCSRLTVQKSKRYYNTPGRMMPGTVFEYAGKRYVLTGQRTNGQ